MPNSEVSTRSRLNACRVKPSKAKPKTTLFGSVMEKVDPEVLERTREFDLDELEASFKPKPQVRNPPPVLAAEVKDPSKLISARQELEASKRDYQKASQTLNDLEKRVLYHPGDVASDIPAPGDVHVQDRPHQWMKSEDLANASAINVLGVDPRKRGETYNRDRYEKRAPVHEYSLHGDYMKRGTPREPNDRRTNAMKNKISQIESNPIDDEMYVSNYNNHYGPKGDSELEFGLKLPKNIEHQFGTKVCQALLADKEKVALTLEEQASRRARHRRERTPLTQKTADVPFTLYDDLGNALRYDHFPGHSTDNHGSTMKEVYTEDVHKNRIPGPDKWRYQRDELTNWLDAIIIQDRLKRAAREAELNTETRPTVVRRPEKPKPQKRRVSPAPDFAAVHFETPPKTPERKASRPEPADLANLPADVEKDKEFWNYYDKGVE